MKISLVLKNLFIIFLLTAGFACRKKTDPLGSKKLTLNLGSPVSTLDPALSYDTVSSTILYQTYDTLFQYHYLHRPYTLEPLLAEDMPKISKDQKTYTFSIKKNVRYHPDPSLGEQPRIVMAEDFITAIKRLAFIETKSNGWFLFEGRIKGIDEFRSKAGNDFEKFKNLSIEGLKAPDANTLIIELIEPYPQLLYAFAMTFTSPIPLETVEYYKNNLGEKIIGTGPFKLTEYNSQLHAVLAKFEHYHTDLYPNKGDRFANQEGLLAAGGKKLPFVDLVEMRVIKEDQTRWLEFKQKNIDMLFIPKDNYNTAINNQGELSDEMKNDGVQLQIAPSLTYWWIGFNMNDALLGKNKYLRKAIAHAIDVDRYIELFTNNTGQKAFSIYPPGVPGYSPANKTTNEYNLEKAAKYLALAGFPKGNGLPEIVYDTRGNHTTARQAAEFIKSELAKININLKIQLNTFPAYLQKARAGHLQMWLDGWALDYPDSENVLQLLITKNHPPGPNTTYFSSPEFDLKFDLLKGMLHSDEKEKLMYEMEVLVHDQIPWVMLFYERRHILYHNRLKNYRYSPIVNNFVKYLDVKENP